MGIPTLISTATASGAANVSITSGIDSTYDEYMFVCIDINMSAAGTNFEFQINVAGESGYNDSNITSTFFSASHNENDSGTPAVSYNTGGDIAQGTGYQSLYRDSENDADASWSGILHLFSPADTTYVKHFYSRGCGMSNGDSGNALAQDFFAAGYINVTGAVDEIQFASASGTFDGVIQMYGIA